MKVVDAGLFEDRITDILAAGRFVDVRKEAGPNVQRGFRIVGPDAVEVRVLIDRKDVVRISGWSIYGNHQFVRGVGCDASGYVITDSGLRRELLDVVWTSQTGY